MRLELARNAVLIERAEIEIPRSEVEAWVSDHLGEPWTVPGFISIEDHDLIEDAVAELAGTRLAALTWVSDGGVEDRTAHRLSAVLDDEDH